MILYGHVLKGDERPVSAAVRSLREGLLLPGVSPDSGALSDVLRDAAAELRPDPPTPPDPVYEEALELAAEACDREGLSAAVRAAVLRGIRRLDEEGWLAGPG